MRQNLKRRPLVDQLIDRLRSDIAAGRYPVGSPLPPEAELQVLFGVGRSTVREGVRVLAHAGVLEVRPGDGTYVRSTSVGSHESLAQRLRRARAREVYEVRGALELEGARLAAVRRTAADLVTLQECLARRGDAMDQPDAFIRADLDFHLGIARATRNSVLIDLTSEFFTAAREAMNQSATLPGDRQVSHGLHEGLYDAIAAQDPAAAKRALQSLIRHTTDRLSAVLGTTADAPSRPSDDVR